MDKNSERELLPDILRGFAIILVVFGHCIQEGSGAAYREEALYFSDRLYQFIYSFHMPLFMMVSGYLNWESVKKAQSKKERRMLLARRASALLAPVFLWTAVDYARILITNYINGEPQPEALVFVYLYTAFNNLWFLWAVWWCFLIVYVMHYFLKDNVLIYGLGFLALFIIPDGLGLGAYKYMLPYFISAYYMHGYLQDKGQELKKTPKLWTLAAAGLVFAGLFVFYNEDSFIYLTGYKVIGKNAVKQLWIDLYRMIIGFAGSCFFILLWQYLLDCANKMNEVRHTNFSFQILRKLGSNSMGIYILSGYLLIFAVQKLILADKPSYLLNLLEALAVIIVSLLMTIIMKKIPMLRKFVGK
ncbi:MAG: acyltransferase [Lachnospiraceae bacterium]|nr:acyltransferase [Lachnospiraceae bacterium]